MNKCTMTRILQCLVWITVMTTSARTQRGYSYSNQTPRTLSYPNTRSGNYEYFRNRHIEQNVHSDYQDPRRQRIQNRVSELRRAENGYTRLNKRGALDPEPSSVIVFPGQSSKSEFEPQIPDECRKLGYCKKVPNYPKEQVRELIETLGDDLKKSFQTDELDTDDVQIAQRFGSEGFSFGLCDATEEILTPESLQDKNGTWCTVLQDRERNMTQGFRAEHCNSCNQRECGCNPLVSFPPGYTSKCVQKYVYRTVLIVQKNHTVAQRPLKVPSCCSCMITVPSF